MPGEHTGGHYSEGAGGRPAQWRKDEQGRLVMPEKQREYLEWYLSEVKDPRTLDEWCALNKVGVNTVRGWHKDPRFQEEHRKRMFERAVDPERLQGVLDALHTSAASLNDVQAAKSYLQWVEKLMPTERIDRDPDVMQMSDEEIVAELRDLLATEP